MLRLNESCEVNVQASVCRVVAFLPLSLEDISPNCFVGGFCHFQGSKCCCCGLISRLGLPLLNARPMANFLTGSYVQRLCWDVVIFLCKIAFSHVSLRKKPVRCLGDNFWLRVDDDWYHHLARRRISGSTSACTVSSWRESLN